MELDFCSTYDIFIVNDLNYGKEQKHKTTEFRF